MSSLPATLPKRPPLVRLTPMGPLETIIKERNLVPVLPPMAGLTLGSVVAVDASGTAEADSFEAATNVSADFSHCAAQPTPLVSYNEKWSAQFSAAGMVEALLGLVPGQRNSGNAAGGKVTEKVISLEIIDGDLEQLNRLQTKQYLETLPYVAGSAVGSEKEWRIYLVTRVLRARAVRLRGATSDGTHANLEAEAEALVKGLTGAQVRFDSAMDVYIDLGDMRATFGFRAYRLVRRGLHLGLDVLDKAQSVPHGDEGLEDEYSTTLPLIEQTWVPFTVEMAAGLSSRRA